MSTISLVVHIEASPKQVFEAITTQEGLSRWWTSDVVAEPVVGSVAEFGFFDRAIVTSFRIEELDPAQRIRWHCVAGPNQYVDSEVVFELASHSSGTDVRFSHQGLGGNSEFVAHAEQSWQRVLESLKRYVETGAGSPISI